MFLGALETFKVVEGFWGYVEMSTCETTGTLSNPAELQFPSLMREEKKNMICPNIIRKSKWDDTCEIFSTVLVN